MVSLSVSDVQKRPGHDWSVHDGYTKSIQTACSRNDTRPFTWHVCWQPFWLRWSLRRWALIFRSAALAHLPFDVDAFPSASIHRSAIRFTTHGLASLLMFCIDFWDVCRLQFVPKTSVAFYRPSSAHSSKLRIPALASFFSFLEPSSHVENTKPCYNKDQDSDDGNSHNDTDLRSFGTLFVTGEWIYSLRRGRCHVWCSIYRLCRPNFCCDRCKGALLRWAHSYSSMVVNYVTRGLWCCQWVFDSHCNVGRWSIVRYNWRMGMKLEGRFDGWKGRHDYDTHERA